jgi:hypothetical protein
MKLCPSGSKGKEVDQECLDKYPLYLASDPTSSKFYIPKDTPKKDYITYDVQLPQGITCSQCVVQWTYYTGNVPVIAENIPKSLLNLLYVTKTILYGIIKLSFTCHLN